jgi:hypothetical protein
MYAVPKDGVHRQEKPAGDATQARRDCVASLKYAQLFHSTAFQNYYAHLSHKSLFINHLYFFSSLRILNIPLALL